MRLLSRTAGIFVLVLVGIAIPPAQKVTLAQIRTVVGVPSLPGEPAARDGSGEQTGTARIRGRVVASDTGAPLRRAQVRLGGGGLREQRTAATDEQGQYQIVD